jgi:dinuclear metal center YbgI/SA1388 family protein
LKETAVPCVADVIRFLQRLAPLALAEEWDNVGLLVGDGRAEVRRVMTCLTLTPDVADEAVAQHVDLIVSHHPVLFRPVQRLTAETSEGRLLLKLIAAGVAVYCAHTAYDSAQAGINQQLAELLGLTEIAPLRPKPLAEKCIIVSFVPAEHLERVQRAVWDAGAGVIGNYSECSFSTRGTGTFRGSEDSNPAVGQAGRLEQADEVRLEIVCPQDRVPEVVRQLRTAHPYEEPAIDVYPTQVLPGLTGAGRFGKLPNPLSLGEVNRLVREKLRIEHLQFAGDRDLRVEQLGVACGSAAEFLREARRVGCQALLTGEARFHASLEARESGLGLILAGHFASERPAMEHLAERLAQEFSDLTVHPSRHETDPLQWT